MKYRQFTHRTHKGFALIATLSLMSLVTILTLGLLMLSVSSTRKGTIRKSRDEARANARLALRLALGELQAELGPDQRVSARAEILDKSPKSEAADGVSNPHYLGVWDSWDTWLTDRKDSLSIQDTYKRGRDTSLFRRWLVSHPDSREYETAINAEPTADMVVLYGNHLTEEDQADQVKVSRVEVRQDDRVTGKYAWWISDESMKARIDLPARDDASTISTAQVASSHTGRPGLKP